jgi:hypothetical protein
MLKAYEAFLLQKGTVKSQYIPFYLKWVSECYTFLNEHPQTRLSLEQKKRFLSQMAKRHEDWQVNQADTALRLYDYFLSRTRVNMDGKPTDQEGMWRDLEERMHQALRLRRRSLSTEKTYLIWLRGFKRWVAV